MTQIDREHYAFMERMSNLMQGRPDVEFDQEPIKALRFVQKHVLLHFATEEAEMEATGFPGFEAHRAEHGRMQTYVAEVASQVATDGRDPDLIGVTIRLLCNLITTHIDTIDREFADFLAHRD